MTIDARPSDAIALALRADCPIFVAEQVMQTAKLNTSGRRKAPPPSSCAAGWKAERRGSGSLQDVGKAGRAIDEMNRDLAYRLLGAFFLGGGLVGLCFEFQKWRQEIGITALIQLSIAYGLIFFLLFLALHA